MDTNVSGFEFVLIRVHSWFNFHWPIFASIGVYSRFFPNKESSQTSRMMAFASLFDFEAEMTGFEPAEQFDPFT